MHNFDLSYLSYLQSCGAPTIAIASSSEFSRACTSSLILQAVPVALAVDETSWIKLLCSSAAG